MQITDEMLTSASEAVVAEWQKMVSEMSPHMSPGDAARSFVSPGNYRLLRAALTAALAVPGGANLAERDDANAQVSRFWDETFVNRVFAEHGTTIDILSKRLDEYAANITAAEAKVSALREALTRAERKLSAYVGVCNGDKELTDTVLPMARRALADSKGEAG